MTVAATSGSGDIRPKGASTRTSPVVMDALRAPADVGAGGAPAARVGLLRLPLLGIAVLRRGSALTRSTAFAVGRTTSHLYFPCNQVGRVARRLHHISRRPSARRPRRARALADPAVRGTGAPKRAARRTSRFQRLPGHTGSVQRCLPRLPGAIDALMSVRPAEGRRASEKVAGEFTSRRGGHSRVCAAQDVQAATRPIWPSRAPSARARNSSRSLLAAFRASPGGRSCRPP